MPEESFLAEEVQDRELQRGGDQDDENEREKVLKRRRKGTRVPQPHRLALGGGDQRR